MKKFSFYIMLLFGFITFSQSQENQKANYDLAYKFSPKSIAKLVHSTAVRPHWLKNGNKFWVIKLGNKIGYAIDEIIIKIELMKGIKRNNSL